MNKFDMDLDDTALVENYSRALSRITNLESKLKEVREVIDMQNAIVNGMRRVLAVSRIVNRLKPDIRLTSALSSYDKCKLSGNVGVKK